MTLASLSTPLCVLQKRSEHEVISLMIHLNIFLLKILNLLGFAFHLIFTNVCIMFLADLLFQIVDSIQKISPHFQLLFTTYSSESDFIHKRCKSFFTENQEFGQLLEGHILCTTDIVTLYPNISHEKAMASFRKFLDAKTEKKVTTETLVELSKIV